jgi:hypothetical protein
MSKVIAYLSHSYRPEDRAINMAVWRRLNEHDVVFAVDPPSSHKDPMDVTFLERMMQRSDGFVAIVPDRSSHSEKSPGADATWSPYQDLECRLAIRANKPRLIVIEKGIDIGPLPEREPVLWFKRSPLELDPKFDQEMKKFIEYARAREREQGALPKIGVLRWMPADPAWQRLSQELRQTSPGTVEVLEIDDRTQDHDLIEHVRNFSVVVADMNPRITPPAVSGLLHGAAIPLFRTYLLEAGDREDEKVLEFQLKSEGVSSACNRPAAAVCLPVLCHAYRVDDRMQPVHFWTEPSIGKAAQTIAKITTGYRKRERRLENQSNGSSYFLSLKGNRVFISTPKELNHLSVPLKEALEEAGMPAFHYMAEQSPGGDQIRGGTLWAQGLEQKIADSDLVLAFISATYWDSKVCVAELTQAIKRWERHQMLIVMCIGDPMPPVPSFMGRYEAERVSAHSEHAVKQLVEAVRKRFSDGSDNDPESVAPMLTALLQRHLGEGENDVRDFLKTVCALVETDAADLASRVGKSLTPSAELINILLSGVQIERFGGGALGRLCFHLRRLERDKPTRDQLTRQFSLLRLFPNLHDVDTWNTRRMRKETVVRLSSDVPKVAYEMITKLAGDTQDPIGVVQRLGGQLTDHLDTSNAQDVINHETCRVCAISSVEELMIPVEWALLPGLAAPLARARAVYRRISESFPGPLRISIEDLFDKSIAGPPRALLFGHGPPGLPNVRTELSEIKRIFDEQYDKFGWPRELVECVEPDQATWEFLKDRLPNSDYDILHIAGHAGWVDGRAVIEVIAAQGQSQWIRGEELGQWLRTSLVRFVYLSCCGGAATPIKDEQLAGWRPTLCREIVEAGVPEVVAYMWPVSDDRSVRFTASFYTDFLKAFDAPAALHAARGSCERDNPLWAASILVKQSTADDRQ